MSIFFLDLAFDVFRFLASVYLVAPLSYLPPQPYHSSDKHKLCRTHLFQHNPLTRLRVFIHTHHTWPLSLVDATDQLSVPNVDEVSTSIARPIRIGRHSVCKFPFKVNLLFTTNMDGHQGVHCFIKFICIGALPRQARKDKEDEGGEAGREAYNDDNIARHRIVRSDDW